MGRRFAAIAIILIFQAAAPADEISDQVAGAKTARLAAIQAADAGLMTAFDDVHVAASTAGQADAASRIATEKRAFEINGALPKSPEMSGPLEIYLGEREAAIKVLEDSYDAAIAECSRSGSTSRAAQLAAERGRLLAQEARTVSAKLGAKTELKPVETPPPPAPDQTTHQFIVEFVGRMHKRIEEVAAEPTKETRNLAHVRMIQDFDSELRTRQIQLKLQINRIEDLTGVYRFWFDPREDSRTEGVRDGTGYFEAALSTRDIVPIKPGDYFLVSGRGRFLAAQANGTYGPNAIDPRANWAGLYNRFGITSGTVFAAVVIGSDVAKYDYCIAIDAFKWKIEHNEAPYNPPAVRQSLPITPAPQPAVTPPPVANIPVPPPMIIPPAAIVTPPVQPSVPLPTMPAEPPPPSVSIAGIPRARHDYPHELDSHAPSYAIIKRVETQQLLETRNARFQKWFGPALRPNAARPDIEVGGNYCSTFWYSTLDWSAERRAAWLYHNSEVMRRDLYQRELEDPEVARAVAELKKKQTKCNPLYVDQQYVSDPDLMFNAEYVDSVFHHDNTDPWSIPWGWLTLFVAGGGVVAVWWASYDGVDIHIPWTYVIIFAIGVVACIFMALK